MDDTTKDTSSRLDQAAAELNSAITPIVSVYLKIFREVISQGGTPKEAISIVAAWIGGTMMQGNPEKTDDA